MKSTQPITTLKTRQSVKRLLPLRRQEEIDPSMLTDFISEYEFSGTMDAGNIRDRIEKPMPLLKKRSLSTEL